MKSIIRVSGFVGKELREIFRQPGLIVALILGPFLILLMFGLGHRAVEAPLNTVLAIPRGVDLPIPPDQYQQLLGSAMKLAYATDNPDAAMKDLSQGNVDLVIAIPPDFYQKLATGQQATVSIFFNQIDPLMTNYIRFVASAQTATMNSRILEATLRQAAAPQGQFDQFNVTVAGETQAIAADIAEGNTLGAEQRIDRLDNAALGLESRLDAIANFATPTVGAQGATIPELERARSAVRRFRDDLGTLRLDVASRSPTTDEDIIRTRGDAQDVAATGAALADLPAKVVAAPLVGSTQNVAAVEPDFVSFYAPAVLALLLQHIAVTFAALAIVRERLFGAMELFRVAPVSAFQVLLGKYLAYTLLAAVVTVALTVLIVGELHVPFSGSYDVFGGLIVALVVASLGFGFCISLVSGSERQAIQLSMLMLIASVFFSGFLLRLDSFLWPVRVVSYLLPVTYGIRSLQELMLRGAGSQYVALTALTGMAVLLFVAGVWLMRRELGRSGGRQADV